MRARRSLKILLLFPGILAVLLTYIFPSKLIPQQPAASKSILKLPQPAKEKAIVIGQISRNPYRKIQRYQPLAALLAANLSEFGITRGKVKIFANIEAAIAAFEQGEIDIYISGSYSGAILAETVGAKAILRGWYQGKLKEYALLITSKDRGINSLEDLKGKTLGLSHPTSTLGYFLPVNLLLQAGFLPVTNFSANTEASQPEIRYIFSRSCKNVIEWVINGKVDAGAVDRRTFTKLQPDIRNSIVILAKTEKLPRQLVLVRGDLDPEAIAKIETILLNLEGNAAGKALLKQLKTSKFERLEAEDLSKIKTIYDRIPYRR